MSGIGELKEAQAFLDAHPEVQFFEIVYLLDGELMHSCQVQFHTQDLL